MNSYFASVEQQANPHLRGRPVGVCEHLGGIIIAPSVEAKRLGIKLGTPVWEAIKIYPGIALLPTDPDKYRHITRTFLKIFSDYSDDVEQFSIDEAFIDATAHCRGDWNDALLLGLEIKQRLAREAGEWVSASVGIGPNKLISKIAADLGDGDIDRIAMVRPHEIHTLYDRLKLTDVPGIGPRLERALHKLGIFTLRRLAAYPLANLLNQFGIWGLVLHELANFEDSSEVISEEEEAKSFGHAYTVPKALTTESQIKRLMFKLSEKVARRMRKHRGRGSVVHYFHSDKQAPPHGVGSGQGGGFSKQRKLKEFIDTGPEIFRVAWSIYSQSINPAPAPWGEVKIMGVSISGLDFNPKQEPLFEHFKKARRLTAALDQINDKFGEYTIQPAGMAGARQEWARDTVGFGRTRSQKAGQ